MWRGFKFSSFLPSHERNFWGDDVPDDDHLPAWIKTPVWFGVAAICILIWGWIVHLLMRMGYALLAAW